MGPNTSDTAYENDFPGIKFWLRLFLLFCRGFMTMLDGNPYLQKKNCLPTQTYAQSTPCISLFQIPVCVVVFVSLIVSSL